MLISTMFFVSGITTLLQTTSGATGCRSCRAGRSRSWRPRPPSAGMAALAGGGLGGQACSTSRAPSSRASLVEIVVGYTGLVGRLLRFIGPITIAPTIALIGLVALQVRSSESPARLLADRRADDRPDHPVQQYLRTHRAFELFPILLAILASPGGVASRASSAGLTLGRSTAGVATRPTQLVLSFENLANAPWIRVPYPVPVGLAEVRDRGHRRHAGRLSSRRWSSRSATTTRARALAGAPISRLQEAPSTAASAWRASAASSRGSSVPANGTTSYSENIGAIGLTRVGSRRVVQVGRRDHDRLSPP